jgi:hypothetical protein
MTAMRITNVSIFDGTGAAAFPGEVLTLLMRSFSISTSPQLFRARC